MPGLWRLQARRRAARETPELVPARTARKVSGLMIDIGIVLFWLVAMPLGILAGVVCVEEAAPW
jgi:hypothetical protein